MSSADVETLFPSMAVIMSPTCMPAASAGPPGVISLR